MVRCKVRSHRRKINSTLLRGQLDVVLRLCVRSGRGRKRLRIKNNIILLCCNFVERNNGDSNACRLRGKNCLIVCGNVVGNSENITSGGNKIVKFYPRIHRYVNIYVRRAANAFVHCM